MTKKTDGKVLALEDVVRENEWHLLDEYGNDSPGYNIPCRFCGWLSIEHELPEVTEKEMGERKKGFRIPLAVCAGLTGYAPINVREWERERRADREESGEKARARYATDRARNRVI